MAMSNNYPKHPPDCPPNVDPAPQPKPPGDGKACGDPPKTEPPELKEPEKCKEPPCCCPPGPGSDSNCLQDLIAQQASDIAAADKAKAFKADLEGLLAKADAAKQEYTQDKYQKLLKQWVEQDAEIAELIRKLVCAVPCWRCIVECHVCPLLNELHYAEVWLYDKGQWCSQAYSLYDLLYWHDRDRAAKERRFLRIKAVLAAWEKPAQTIEKALADDAKLIADIGKSLGTEASKAVYDLFFKLVPLHLAIAPPAGPGQTTKIDKKFTQFCDCDTGTPDDCCGPDVGEWSLRQRLIGPQPYLINPNDYFTVICCLVKHRYGPAKDALGQAEAAWVTVDNKIKRYKAQIENGLKSFDKDAKAAIPAVVDCCTYEKKKDDDKGGDGGGGYGQGGGYDRGGGYESNPPQAR
jgi:hypothetical protein